MVQQVENHRLFHVTIQKTYKVALAIDQTIRLGDGYNPFFQFYENAREYAVAQENGTVMNVKAVSWLKHVRDGKITVDPARLASIASDIAVHYVMLCRELIMEQVRRDDFKSEPPSRQRCLYACETLDQARHWNDRLGGGSICELSCTGTIHRADAALLLGDSEPLSLTIARAKMYWRGERSNHPEWETLFVGDAKVVGFNL